MNDKNNLREEIDLIDNEIALLLKRRFAVVKKIGEFKQEYNLPVKDAERELQVLNKVVSVFDNEGEKKAIKDIYLCIMHNCTEMQK